MPLSSRNKEKLTPYKAKWESALIHFLLVHGSGTILQRTLPYLNSRMYDFIVESSSRLSCMVEGNRREYETIIKPDTKTLSTDCACPIGGECKHSLALALAVAWHAQKAGHVFPPELEQTYAQAFKLLDKSNLDIPGIEIILGRPVARAGDETASHSPERWWEPIAANAEWAQQRRIFQEVLKLRLPGVSFWNIDNATVSLKAVKNPIHRLKAMNLKVDDVRRGYSYNRSARVQPEPDQGLLDFLASPEAAELEEKYEREVAQSDLIEWLQTAGRMGDDQRRPDRLEVTWTALPTQDGFWSLYFQLKADAGQRGLLARKPNGVLQVGRDITDGSRDFGHTKNKLINWLTETHCFGSIDYPASYKPDDETLIPVAQIYQWVAAWSRHVRWSDGGFISLSPWSAELTLSGHNNIDPQWVIQFPRHGDKDSREILFADADLLVDRKDEFDDEDNDVTNYFIREGDSITPVETHGMSPMVLRAIRKLGSIPMEILAGTPAGSALFHLLTQGRKSTEMSRWIQEIPCRAEVELAVDDSADFVVTARANAITEDGPSFYWRPLTGWTLRVKNQQKPEDGGQPDVVPDDLLTVAMAQAATEKAAAAVSVPLAMEDELLTAGVDGISDGPEIETSAADPQAAQRPHLHSMPRRDDVEPLEQWLDDVASCVGSKNAPAQGVSFSGRLSSIGVAAFLPLWFQRPAGVEYYGNADFRKMITVRAAPRISIKSEPSGMDWLKVSVSLEDEINQTSLAEMSRVLAASAENFVRLPNGGIYRRAELEEYRDQMDHLNALGLGIGPGEQRLHALHLAGAPAGALSRLEAGGGGLTALAEKSRQILREFTGIPTAPVAPETGDFLRPYQRTGVNFLAWAANNFGGALLADDMGLGKTLQMLATLSSLRDAAIGAEAGANADIVPGPSLVICPASVAHNWEREAHRFAPGLSVLVLERGGARRKQLEELTNYDLVIMNFALLRRDIETLSPIKWFAIVVDEAQAIKNPNAESSRALKLLNARYRFALTGTPIENRISDLYSIVDFALPGYLGPLDKSTSSADPETAARASRLLRSRLRPVLTRRLKAEVAPELPERVETRIDCDMGTAQKKLYAAEVKRVRLMLTEMSDSGIKGKHRIEMLAALMRLRQICCDPLLLGHPEIPSGKTEELLELVPPLLEAGHKVLIFSQFVKMLNHLEEQLIEKEIQPYKLTGATTNRQTLVDEFEKDPNPSVFLISLKAGGTGLNLVSASHVILFDPWWNPSVEAQAIDRTHRIGQDKTVVAYRLVTQGTIEERILELQEKKRALVRNILEEDSFNRTLTSEDFQFLLGG